MSLPMSWKTTQPSLLLRVRDSADAAAWSEFDRRYGELIVRYCRSRGLQQTDAEDIRQIVLMNLSRALKNFEYSPARGKFRTYLGRAVRNAMTRLARRPDRRLYTLDQEEQAPAPEVEDDASWEDEWVRHHYRQAMQTVRQTFEPRSVEVFDRLLAGATTAQVAEEFDMTTEAVHKVKQRIRDRLKGLIAQQIKDEDGA